MHHIIGCFDTFLLLAGATWANYKIVKRNVKMRQKDMKN